MHKKSIESVISALEKYLQHIIETKNFNIQDFVNFMEPIFAQAGYRDKKISSKENVLIILDAHGVGDFLWKTGILREIRRIYPEANIRLVMFPAAQSIAETCPYVDEIIFNPMTFNFVDFIGMFKHNIEVAKKLLTEQINVCYAFPYYHHTPLLMYMSGAAERISFKFGEDDTINWPDSSAAPHLPYTFKRSYLNQLATISVPQFLYGGHNVDISFALLDYILKMPVAKRNMEVWLTAPDKTIAHDILSDKSRHYIALAMGGNTLHKHYPPEKYAALIKMILREEENSVFAILGGGGKDLQSAEILKNALPEEIQKNHIIDLTNKLTHRQSAAVLNLCEIFIGNDTGLMHIAAAENVPALAVFCYPADLPEHRITTLTTAYPYQVASVIVQPSKSLPECAAIKANNYYGCKSSKPHCITQIEPATVFEGYRILKERISKNIIETLYIH